MNKALITGIEGFTGRYLAHELSMAGYEVYGLSRSVANLDSRNINGYFCCDLCNEKKLSLIINRISPDYVIHLAGISFVAHGDTDLIYKTNIIGTRNLLESIDTLQKKPSLVLLASSANIYGNSREGKLDEMTSPAPANDYAVSKLAMEYMASLYHDRLPITIVRPFNYTGVGQSESFLLPKIVNHIRRNAPVIELGNLDIARDFSDVRCVVQYYRRLLETPSAIGQEFNVCSGKAYTLDCVLDMARQISGHDFEVRVNPAFVRVNEVKTLIGNRAKLDQVVGQVPELSLQDTLRWMIEAPQ